jgi:hypothetical protein
LRLQRLKIAGGFGSFIIEPFEDQFFALGHAAILA